MSNLKAMRLLISISVVLGSLLLCTNVFGEDLYVYPGKTPYKVEISPDGNHIVVAMEGSVAVVNKVTMGIVAEHDFPYLIVDMALSPDGNFLCFAYLVDTAPQHLGKMDLATGQVQVLDLTPAIIDNLIFDPTGGYIYVGGGTFPEPGEWYDLSDYNNNIGTGKVFELDNTSFEITRSADVGVGNSGISYQGGKIVFISQELSERDGLNGEGQVTGRVCYILDADDLGLDYSFTVGDGDYSNTFAIPGTPEVMLGFRSDCWDGVGFALVNASTGVIEQWFITDPDYHSENPNEMGGGHQMTVDPLNNILYSTAYYSMDFGDPYFRIWVIDLNTNELSEWDVEPFREYSAIAFDTFSGKLYLTAPDDDVIVVLDPPG